MIHFLVSKSKISTVQQQQAFDKQANIQIAPRQAWWLPIANNAKQKFLNISRIFDISGNHSRKIKTTKQAYFKASFANIIFAVYHPPVTAKANKFIIGTIEKSSSTIFNHFKTSNIFIFLKV